MNRSLLKRRNLFQLTPWLRATDGTDGYVRALGMRSWVIVAVTFALNGRNAEILVVPSDWAIVAYGGRNRRNQDEDSYENTLVHVEIDDPIDALAIADELAIQQGWQL